MVILLSNIAWFLMTITPVLFYLISYVGRGRLSTKPSSYLHYSQRVTSVFLLSLFLVWFFDIVSYIPIGAVTVALTRYFTLVSPVVAAVCIQRLLARGDRVSIRRQKDFVRAYFGVLLILALILFSNSMLDYSENSRTNLTDVNQSANWFFDRSVNAPFIYSDHNTQGEFAIVAAEHGFFFVSANTYTEESYSHLVASDYSNVSDYFFSGSYVVVNLELSKQKTTAGGWMDFEPLDKHVSAIKANQNLDMNYDDGIVNIFLGA
jgi:hypothetical protein